MGCNACKKDCLRDEALDANEEPLVSSRNWNDRDTKEDAATEAQNVFGSVKPRDNTGIQSNESTGVANESTGVASDKEAAEARELNAEEERKAADGALQVEGLSKATAAEDNAATSEVADGNGSAAQQESTPPLSFQERMLKEATAVLPILKEVVPPTAARRPSTIGTNYQSYVDSQDKLWNTIRDMESMSGWNFKKEQDGAQIYLKATAGSALVSFKAIVEVPLGKMGLPYVLDQLLQIEQRTQWDPMCTMATTVEAYPPYYRVTYVRMAAPSALIANRDLCLLGRLRFEDDGGVMCALESIDHPDAPVAPGHVRAIMAKGAYILRYTDSKKDKVRAMYFATVDPSGWLPTWVANVVAWKQGLGLALFAKSLKDV